MRYLALLGIIAVASSILVGGMGASAQPEPVGAAQLGEVHFPVSCSAGAQAEFDRATALLHSFFYPETVKAYTGITEAEPSCTMAYWGIAMAVRQNPLIPVTVEGLQPGKAAIEHALADPAPSQRERDWIAALAAYYQDLETASFQARVLAYEAAMEQLYRRYPNDSEAAVFYALALNEAVDPSDKTYARQLRAGAILEEVFAQQPNHPGAAHYIIHSYDYSPLAERALPAALEYAAIAPAAPHALHMPSHTFSILGMWPEVIESNLASEAVAKAYGAQNQPGQTTWLHAQDFMVHAYLQLAQDRAARAIVDERNTIAALDPVRLPNDTAFAAIPVRYVLERGAWEEAAALDTRGLTFPQAKAIIHFGRALGAARRGDPAAAQPDLQALGVLNNGLVETHDPYWADQVEIQGLAAAAWIAHAQGQDAEAVELMGSAADREDASEKHIAMENRLWPMRELLGELLLEAGQPAAALTEFEASLQVVPNRFRAFAGAARAAEQLGDQERALGFYARLVALGENADTDRPELIHARIVLAGAEAYGL